MSKLTGEDIMSDIKEPLKIGDYVQHKDNGDKGEILGAICPNMYWDVCFFKGYLAAVEPDKLVKIEDMNVHGKELM